MATEMNVEAERAAFETAMAGKLDFLCQPGADYFYAETGIAWDTWQAASRAAQPADVGAGELPFASIGEDGLPELPGVLPIDDHEARHSADQMRQYGRDAIAADRRAREVYEVPIPGDGFFGGMKMKIDPTLPPDTIEMHGSRRLRTNLRTGQITEVRARDDESPQASQGVKTWQERMAEYYSGDGTKLMRGTGYFKDREIVDLRAHLASSQQAKEYEQRHAVESEKALAQAHAQLARQSQGEPAAWMVNFKRAPNAAPDRALYWKYNPLVAGHVVAGDKVTPLYAAPPLSSEPQVERQSAGQMQNCRSTEKVQVVQAGERQAEKGGA